MMTVTLMGDASKILLQVARIDTPTPSADRERLLACNWMSVAGTQSLSGDLHITASELHYWRRSLDAFVTERYTVECHRTIHHQGTRLIELKLTKDEATGFVAVQLRLRLHPHQPGRGRGPWLASKVTLQTDEARLREALRDLERACADFPLAET